MTAIDQFRRSPEKRLPAALVAAFLLQTAGALFWAGSARARDTRGSVCGVNYVIGGDRIEAWRFGPVIPNLYDAMKRYGSLQIDGPLLDPYPSPISQQQNELLEAVVTNYGHLSGPALSNLTHRAGSPWSKVWKEGSRHIEIPVSVIRTHYEMLKDSPTVSAA